MISCSICARKMSYSELPNGDREIVSLDDSREDLNEDLPDGFRADNPVIAENPGDTSRKT